MGFMSFLGAAERQVNPFDNGKTAKNPQGNGQNKSTATQVKNTGWNFLKGAAQPFVAAGADVSNTIGNAEVRAGQAIGIKAKTGVQTNKQQFGNTLGNYVGEDTLPNFGKAVGQVGLTMAGGPLVKAAGYGVTGALGLVAPGLADNIIGGAAAKTALGVGGNLLPTALTTGAKAVAGPLAGAAIGGAYNPLAGGSFKQGALAGAALGAGAEALPLAAKGAVAGVKAIDNKAIADSARNPAGEIGSIGKDVNPNTDIHIPVGDTGNYLRISNDEMNKLTQAKSPQDVKKIIGDSLPADVVNRVAPSLANTKDPHIISNVLSTNLSPPKPVDTTIAPPVNPTPSPQAGQSALADLANKSTSFQDFEKQFTALPEHPDLQAAVEQASQQHGTLEEYYNSLKPNTASQQVINSLKEANSTRAQQEAGYAEERSRRIGAATQAGKDQAGTQGYYSELSQLKGELPKEAYTGLSDKLNPKQQEDLFSQLRDQVKQTNQGYSSINAQTALHKVIFGNEGVPTNSEIKLLQNTFGDDFANAVKEDVASHNQKISTLKSVGNKVAEIAGVPRAIMASTDFSGGLRQGLAAATRHPIIFAKAFAGQFGDFFSEKHYQQSQAAIENHPNFPLMQRGKLAIQDVGSKAPSEHEEQFVSQLAERIPIIGRLIRASDRAYTGILNNMRANIFNQLVETAKNAGHDFEQPESQKLLKDIGTVVNTSTGRGNLGRLETAGHALSTALFAPRLIASRLSMLDPRYYINLDPIARKEALTTLASLGAVATTVLGAAELGGASVNKDPTNADFGKIKVGDTRFDILGGYQQYLRLGAQLAEGKSTSSLTGHSQTLGKGIAATRWDVLTRFLTNKEAPVPSFVTTALRGKDNAGNPIDYKHEVLSRFTPLLTQDIHDLMTHPNSPGPVAGVAGALGVGLQTYGPQDTTPTPKQTAYIKSIKDPAQAQATKQLFQVLKTAPAKADAKNAIVSAMQKGDTNKVIELAKQFNSKYDATANDWFKTNEKYYQQDPNLVKEYRSGYITESTLNSWDKAIQSAKKGPSL